MNQFRKTSKRKANSKLKAAAHNPQLGYMVDDDIIKTAVERDLQFDFCPQCKMTVELSERPNKYNPKKTVKICRQCGIIRKGEIWKEFENRSQ